MKKLIIISAVMTAVSVNAALPPATSPNVISNNSSTVEYTRRGAMGTKDYVVTDINDSKLVQRGCQTFGNNDIEGDASSVPSSVWQIAESTIDQETGKIIIKIPAKTINGDDIIIDNKKVYVGSSMMFNDYGYEYLSVLYVNDIHNFVYRSLGPAMYMSNIPFCYGTNRLDSTKVDKFELPRGGKSETTQNDNLIFCDRAWVTNFIIKAGIKTESEVINILQSMQ